jgi:hypothetical protein
MFLYVQYLGSPILYIDIPNHLRDPQHLDFLSNHNIFKCSLLVDIGLIPFLRHEILQEY